MINSHSNQHKKRRIRAPRSSERGALISVDISQQSDAFLIAFGHKVREIRASQQLTQEDLARQVPLDRSYLAQIEHGKRQISLWKAFLLANALKCSLDELIE